jgi:hypothetical protein
VRITSCCARGGRPTRTPTRPPRTPAEDLYESTLANLARWWERWWLPTVCRGTGHRTAVVGETDDEGVIYQEDEEPALDLDRHDGMRLFDVWVAGSDAGSMAVGLAPDAAAFWAALEADLPDRAARLHCPERAIQVLLLTDHSGAGDLRNT